VHPKGEDAPELTFNLATSDSSLAGNMSMTGAQDPSVQVYECETGIVATNGGAAPAVTSTTSTTAPPPTSTTIARPTAGSGGPCDKASLVAALAPGGLASNESRAVEQCNGSWALLSWHDDDAEGVTLLEWNGSAWTTGACQRYGNPNDITYVPPEVPPEYFIACQVG
jgi:hypothetical protein